MELLQLQYFVTVARLENITHAAKRHGVPQPAMSQTISRLEKDLGVRLFDRQGNRLHLNEKGALFLGYAERALGELETGADALREGGGELTGRISLLVLENRNLMIDLVARFAGLHPHVAFSISHTYNAGPQFTCDLCVAARCPYPYMDKSVPLVEEEIKLAVPKGHPLAGRQSVAIRDLAGETLVSMSPETYIYQMAAAWFRQQGLPFQTAVICDDPFSVRRYVSIGMGLAFVPARSWQGLMGEAVLLSLEGEGFRRTTRLYWDEGRYMPLAARAFRDFLTAEAPNRPAPAAKG